MTDEMRRFFSGDTLQQALVQAANYFHLQPEQIAYKAIEKRHGFVKRSRKAMIEVDPAAPQRVAEDPPPPIVPREPLAPPVRPPAPAASPVVAAPSAQAAASPASAVPPAPAAPPARHSEDSSSRRPRGNGRDGGRRGFEREGRRPQGRERTEEPRSGSRVPGTPPPFGFRDAENPAGQPQGTDPDLLTLPDRSRSTAERFPPAEGPRAEAALKGVEILLKVAGLELTAKVYQGEERLEIDLQGPDSDWCFADDGELLMSIEHLLPRIIRTLSGESVLCRVDCDNFHEIREERLRSLAQKVADEVRQNGKPRTMVPMNPADRRIVHVTLTDNPSVLTESQGEGYFKRITVRLAPVPRET
jgi:predicted RNA-binding protein Jag